MVEVLQFKTIRWKRKVFYSRLENCLLSNGPPTFEQVYAVGDCLLLDLLDKNLLDKFLGVCAWCVMYVSTVWTAVCLQQLHKRANISKRFSIIQFSTIQEQKKLIQDNRKDGPEVCYYEAVYGRAIPCFKASESFHHKSSSRKRSISICCGRQIHPSYSWHNI